MDSINSEPATASTSTKNNVDDESSKKGADKSKDDVNDGVKKANGQSIDCNICLSPATEAVVSFCGHLFCWPCLHQWLETRPDNPVCPVCKSAISKEKVVPIYGHDGDQTDPRTKTIPPRPQGQRSEARNNFFNVFGNGMNGPPNGGGFQLSFGLGAFPFTFFGTTFNFGHGQGAGTPQQNAQNHDVGEDISHLFLWLALLFMLWLLFI